VAAEILDLTLQAVNAELGEALYAADDGVRARARERIQHHVGRALAARGLKPSIQAEDALIQTIEHKLLGYGFLESLLPPVRTDLTEIAVNSDGSLWIKRKDGADFERVTDIRFEPVDVYDVVGKILGPLGRRANEANPIESARLPATQRMPAGARVHVVVPPIAVGRFPHVNIRLFEEEHVRPERLIEWGALNQEILDFLAEVVRRRRSLVVAGGTGSGKTTLLNVLSNFIPRGDRVITIEDTAELRLNTPHWVRLETRPASIEGQYEITMLDCINASLRMTPTWVIVGEIRSGGAAAMLLQTQISGNYGMSTIHAETPKKAVETLILRALQSGQFNQMVAVKTLIALSVDYLVQIQYDAARQRRITHVSEVREELKGGDVWLDDLFRYDGSVWKRVGEPQRL